MAKLSAKNRKELARVSKECLRNDSDLIDWERTTYALMSDGHILSKRDVRFRPDTFNPSGKKHSYGWKDKGLVKGDVTPERFVAAYLKVGYTQEK